MPRCRPGSTAKSRTSSGAPRAGSWHMCRGCADRRNRGAISRRRGSTAQGYSLTAEDDARIAELVQSRRAGGACARYGAAGPAGDRRWTWRCSPMTPARTRPGLRRSISRLVKSWDWTGYAIWRAVTSRRNIGTGWRSGGCWTISPSRSAASPESFWPAVQASRIGRSPKAARWNGPAVSSIPLKPVASISVAKLMLASSQIQNLN